ncbi:unnamed protein product [Prorocentrum cordatum]|uniref:CBS domain-containing protein n=1 Tax=Prorocentrum cordatum TaxID=2364126 RepID=A0ABN9S1X3_9DINO|nr:unnamed protein product [Polarella glacialis]
MLPGSYVPSHSEGVRWTSLPFPLCGTRCPSSRAGQLHCHSGGHLSAPRAGSAHAFQVTESRMAIGMALEGGVGAHALLGGRGGGQEADGGGGHGRTPVEVVPRAEVVHWLHKLCWGVIHTNMTIEEQAEEVSKVKKYKSGFITDPICIKPTMTLHDLDRLAETCGFTGFPVTEDGRMGSKLLGLVTRRDTDFVKARKETSVSQIMTKAAGLGDFLARFRAAAASRPPDGALAA